MEDEKEGASLSGLSEECARVERAGHADMELTLIESRSRVEDMEDGDDDDEQEDELEDAAAQAIRQAAADGLTLERSGNAAGYRGVTQNGRYGRFQANIGHRNGYLGSFGTAEEAAHS